MSQSGLRIPIWVGVATVSFMIRQDGMHLSNEPYSLSHWSKVPSVLTAVAMFVHEFDPSLVRQDSAMPRQRTMTEGFELYE